MELVDTKAGDALALGYVKDTEIGTFTLTVFNDDSALAEDEITARLCGIELCPVPESDGEEEVVEPVVVPDTVENVYSFDFGTRNSGIEGFTTLGTEAYAEETGYGFVTDAAQINPARVGFDLSAYSYDPETEAELFTAASDMAFATDVLEFRVDLEAGDYYLTTYASAGYYNATYANNKISISVNGAEFEEVGIPAYAGTKLSDLALMTRVSLEEAGSVVIRVDNEGGRAFLSALLIDQVVTEEEVPTEYVTSLGTWVLGSYSMSGAKVEKNQGRIRPTEKLDVVVGNTYEATVTNPAYRMIVRKVDAAGKTYVDFQTYVKLFENGICN